MSSSLFALAALCLVAAVSGAAVIQQTAFTDAACTTGATVVNSITTGECSTASVGAGESRSYYCSNDGSLVYMVSFADTTCKTPYSVSSTSTACGFSAAQIQQKCLNATAGPAAPITPGTNDAYLQGTSCKNSTKPNFGPADSCSATGANVKCSNSAYNTGFCKTTGDLPAGMLSSTIGCSTDQTLRGQAYYTDAACQNFAMAEVQEADCNGGSVVNSCGSTLLPALPSKLVVTFPGTTCVDDYYNPSSATFFTDGCVNSREFSCVAGNNTMIGTLKTYSDPTNKGLCTNLVSTQVQAEGACVNGQVFYCSYTPQGNSAAAAASSFVAMIVAAFVALVAARSL